MTTTTDTLTTRSTPCQPTAYAPTTDRPTSSAYTPTLTPRVPTRVFAGQAVMRRPARTLDAALTRPAAPTQTDLVASQPTVDAKRRIGLGKLTRELGLSAGDSVVAVVDGARVRITHADAPRRPGFPVVLQLDVQQRLTLTIALCHTLGVAPGNQVQAIADALTGEVTLISLDTALRHLLNDTGVTDITDTAGASCAAHQNEALA